MPSFVLKQDCPHCHTSKAGMRGEFPIFTASGCRVPLTCPHCWEVIVAPVAFEYSDYRWAANHNPNAIFNLQEHNGKCVLAGEPYPAPAIADTPPHVPRKIDEAFKEAKENFARGKLETCVLLCGKAMDLATKSLDGTWKLEKRLKALATEGTLTKDMADWAEEIRLDRNTAIHEDHDFTPDQAKAIVSFTEAFLTYIYTLPAMVKAHRARKGEPPANAEQ